MQSPNIISHYLQSSSPFSTYILSPVNTSKHLLLSGSGRRRVQPLSFLSGRPHISGKPRAHRFLELRIWLSLSTKEWFAWLHLITEIIQYNHHYKNNLQVIYLGAKRWEGRQTALICVSIRNSDPPMEAATTTRWEIEPEIIVNKFDVKFDEKMREK